jgi:hypothetical protein
VIGSVHVQSGPKVTFISEGTPMPTLEPPDFFRHYQCLFKGLGLTQSLYYRHFLSK